MPALSTQSIRSYWEFQQSTETNWVTVGRLTLKRGAIGVAGEDDTQKEEEGGFGKENMLKPVVGVI